MEKINVAELLKYCPKGMELYSPLCGKCVFDRVNFGTIICKKQNTQEITFTSKGYYMLPVFDDCECMIFPSKDQRDWSKFVPPYKFKDGDIVVCTNTSCTFTAIFKSMRDDSTFYRYGVMFDNNFRCLVNDWSDFNDSCRLATEEEKTKLFDAIKSHGYKWNPETKTLEKLVEPKFKVGDRIKHKTYISQGAVVTEIKDTHYILDDESALPFTFQDEYDLVPNKFDITTLVPFESRVLVRYHKGNKWCGSFFSHIDGNLHSHCYKYVTVAGSSYPMCIPYEGNEHLLGKTGDCDEFYKNW